MHLDEVAERFQTAGIASVVYDQRNLGASDGLPRSEILPHQQSEDYHDAVTFLRNIPEVDDSKIAIWGYSLSGGHAIKAGAIDRRIKAVISVCPMISSIRASRHLSPEPVRLARDTAVLADRASRARGEEVTYSIIASLDPEVPAVFTAADGAEWFFRLQQTKAPAWENRHTVQSLFNLASYNPEGFLEGISPTPWLLIQADADTLCPLSTNQDMFEKASEPKEIVVFAGHHFSAFGAEAFDKTMAAEIDFLKRKLDF